MILRMCLLTVSIVAACLPAAAKIDVVASAPNLADIAGRVGGGLVSVTSLARPTEDIHFVEPRPSFVAKLRGADLVVLYGMNYDLWMRPLIDNARNARIRPGGQGYVDASVGIRKLEVPRGKIDMSMGELHPQGNPHYLLDPENARTVAKNILNGLVRVSPGDAETFRANYSRFSRDLDAAIDRWERLMGPSSGSKVVTYHRSWIYFLRRFKLDEFGNVEPKPGIPPSASHIRDLIADMKREKVRAIIMEPYYSRKFPDMVASQTGAAVLVLPTSVGTKGIDSYFDLIDAITKAIAGELR